MITFKNFGAALEYGPAQRAVFNSLFAGTVAGIIATGLGVLIAWYNLRIRGKAAIRATLDTVSTAPVGMPGIVFGVGFLVFSLLAPFPLFGTIWLLVLTYVALHLPYAVRICSSAFVQIHPELEDAGYVCGAGRAGVLSRIVLRLSIGAVVASMVYVSLRSFREYAASIFLTSHGNEVFSVLVLDMWEGGNSTILAAYVTMVMILVALITGVSAWINNRLGSPAPTPAA
jgi:iron(III) transport system permease protein